MSVEIRPSRRDDREQLTGLVNAHVRAVVPAIALSVNTVMSQLEREPGEPIVDPCVRQRLTLVAIEHDAVVAGAHLLRYRAADDVGDSYRDAGESRRLVPQPAALGAGPAPPAAVGFSAVGRWPANTPMGPCPPLAPVGSRRAGRTCAACSSQPGSSSWGRIEVILVAPVD